MTFNQHSILGIHATTNPTISFNDLIDALNNLANAATSKNSLINTQATTIKSQQLTIEELTVTNAKLYTIIESLSKKSTTPKLINRMCLNIMATIGSMATSLRKSHEQIMQQPKGWPHRR